MSQHRDPFFQVPQTTRSTSQGDVDLPIFYFDASNVFAFFLADRDAAAARLGTELQLALTIGNRALAGLAFYEYRQTGVGVYNEVGLALPVLPEGAPPVRNLVHALYGSVDERHLGFHVLDLPVTTDLACAGGREIWGFPKFVTDIPFRLDRKKFESSVRDPDGQKSIVSLSGRLSPGLPMPPMSMVLYTHLEEEILRSTVNVRGRVTLRPGHTLRLQVGESHHRMANNLRDLGLDGARPVAVMDTHRFQSRLNAGVPIARAVAPATTDQSTVNGAGTSAAPRGRVIDRSS